jgi:hypothetical protein
MEWTSSRSWAQNNWANDTNAAPRSIYYDYESSYNEFESVEDDDDEYLPRDITREMRSTVTGHTEDGDLYLSDSNQAAVDQEIPYEEVTQQSARRFFFLDFPLPMGPYFPEFLQLEFFQSVPHDPAATLCRLHFLQLARSWYLRRQGNSEIETHDLGQSFPDGVGAPPSYGRDMRILLQAVWDEPWRKMPLSEFMEILERSVTSAEDELWEKIRLAIIGMRRLPRCDLENCGRLLCGYCLALQGKSCLSLQGNEVNLYGALREARGIGHGRQLDGDDPGLREHERRKRRELHLDGQKGLGELDMRAAYVSVGGLHFVVDVCGGNTMIRFQ